MYDTYKLFRQRKVYDAYGQLQDKFEIEDLVDVQVGYKNVITTQGEVIYQARSISGFTNYNSFIPGQKYKLVNDEHEYIVESFLPFNRRSVLTLKEVL